MAEVLSQNQIDMLLAAMNSGDDTEKTKSKENSPESMIFTAPRNLPRIN